MISNLIPISETWVAMEELVRTGKARSIGVSNFSQVLLEELLSTQVPSFQDIRIASNLFAGRRSLQWSTR